MHDTELKHTPLGAAASSFVLASNRSFKQEEVAFFEITTWSRLVKGCGAYLKKGRGVRVLGRFKQDRWTDLEATLDRGTVFAHLHDDWGNVEDLRASSPRGFSCCGDRPHPARRSPTACKILSFPTPRRLPTDCANYLVKSIPQVPVTPSQETRQVVRIKNA
jgi:hypothetical protein